MKNITLNIGGSLLDLGHSDTQKLLTNFEHFVESKAQGTESVWKLASLAKCRRSPANAKFQNTPVLVDTKNRKIIRYLDSKRLQEKPRHIDSQFTAFAVAQSIASRGGILMHAAAVVKNSKAYLFFGKSGDGKSTAAKISRRHKVIGDDVIAVINKGGHFYACATPWKQGKFIKVDKRQMARVHAIFFLRKSRRVYFEPMAETEALSSILYNHVHFFNFTEKKLACKIWRTAVTFSRRLPAFRMEFRRTADFWPELTKILRTQGHL